MKVITILVLPFLQKLHLRECRSADSTGTDSISNSEEVIIKFDSNSRYGYLKFKILGVIENFDSN